MLLDHLGETEAAACVERAVVAFLESKVLPGMSAKEIKESGLSTTKIGDIIADYAAKV
jgi:isocitrate/isopropylmalate dehydrogenase